MIGTLLSCFFVLLISFFLTNVHGLKVPFEQRAVGGASASSPRTATRHTFGTIELEVLANVRDLRVNIFFSYTNIYADHSVSMQPI
jgi:hypothetical protein